MIRPRLKGSSARSGAKSGSQAQAEWVAGFFHAAGSTIIH
jgi:hypothetical protein